MGVPNYTAKFSDDEVDFFLNILVFEEDGIVAAYSPALDLFGYGNSEEEARDSFNVVLDEFVRYAIDNNTLESELKRLGWIRNKEKTFTPPKMASILQWNPVAANIYDTKEFRQRNQKLPSFR